MLFVRFRRAALAASLVLLAVVVSGCAEENVRARRASSPHPASYVTPRDHDR